MTAAPVRRAVGSVWLLAVPLLCPAFEPVLHEAPPESPRDHVLFVGTEVSVQYEGELVPVRRIQNRDVELATSAREVVKIRQTEGLRLRPATKVSTTELTVEGLEVEPCHSPAKDPARAQLSSQQQLQAYITDRVGAAEQSLRDASKPPAAITNTAAIETGPGTGSEAAFQDLSDAMDMTMMRSVDSDPLGDARGRQADFDAVQLNFTLSSPVPVREVQAVVVLRLERDGEPFDLSFAHALGDVGPKPRRLMIWRGGMPPGMTIRSSRLHFFTRTEELPSNLSEKKYAVTAEEAREYLRLVHLDRHRWDNAMAEPGWSLVPPEFLGRADGRELDFPVQVELDENGRVESLHSTAGEVPAPVRELIEAMVFLPAMDRGNAVRTTLTVNLADFFR